MFFTVGNSKGLSSLGSFSIAFSKKRSASCLSFKEVVLRWISCHGRNYSQPYFCKRNQSNDNRSHGFGAKFLLKKLSASDFSYERKSAFRVLMIMVHCKCI